MHTCASCGLRPSSYDTKNHACITIYTCLDCGNNLFRVFINAQTRDFIYLTLSETHNEMWYYSSDGQWIQRSDFPLFSHFFSMQIWHNWKNSFSTEILQVGWCCADSWRRQNSYLRVLICLHGANMHFSQNFSVKYATSLCTVRNHLLLRNSR